MRRRRVKDDYIASWFSYEPVSRPAPKPSARARSPRRAPPADSAGFVRFAIVGTRGIPARYGGFETFAEELSTRLAARGHHVTVYCRERSPNRPIAACICNTLPTIRHKYFDTIAHTFLSTLHLLDHRVRTPRCTATPRTRLHLDAAHRSGCRSR